MIVKKVQKRLSFVMISSNFKLGLIHSLLFLTTIQAESIVQTRHGKLQGLQDVSGNVTVYSFLGIPFAIPPVGQLRFQKPVPWTKQWSKTRPANTLPKPCFQDASGSSSEDCLYLNVWTTATLYEQRFVAVPKKPVFVFVVGGAFVRGGTDAPKYYGKNLAANIDAVVVTMNYRVGALGFIYGGTWDTPGNLGLHDQALALTWVKNNIHLFGGDPNAITLAGQSAGGMSVSLHLLSPIASQLFKQAIAMSGAVLGDPLAMSKDVGLLHANALSDALGCGSNATGGPLPPKTLLCLRNIDAKKLLHPKVNAISKTPTYGRLNFMPIYGDAFIPENPLTLLATQRHKMNTSVILGTVSWEGTIVAAFEPQVESSKTPKEAYINRTRDFLADLGGDYNKVADEALAIYFGNVADDNELDCKKAYFQILGDLYFDCPTKVFAEQLSKTNHVYQYVTSQVATSRNSSIFEPSHGDDMGILFDTMVNSSSDKILWREMMKDLMTFVRTGKTSYMPYTKFTNSGFLHKPFREYLKQNTTSEFVAEYRSLTCSFWKDNVWLSKKGTE